MTRKQEVAAAVGGYIIAILLVWGSLASCYAVLPQNIENFVVVGEHKSNVYLVDPQNVTPKGEKISFVGLAGRGLGRDEEGRAIIDAENYVFSIFEADCKTFQYAELSRYGKLNGEKYTEKIDKPAIQTAREPTIIFYALKRICLAKPSLYV